MGQRPVAMKKHRINAHPARRIYRKIARIESGVRQKTFGSCDLIMEDETGHAKCLAPSALAPPVAGLFLSIDARHAGGACKSMNHAQRYLAQANRQIAELTVQIARQRVIVRHDTG